MVVIIYMLLCMLNSGSDFDITQTNWQGGPGENQPVTEWIGTFFSCDCVNWFNFDGDIYLDYDQDLQDNVVDGNAGAPYSVVATNMDSDTDTDLLVTSWSDDVVCWYRNDGDGVSWTCVEIAAQFDGACCAEVFDVNDDGFQDVVAAAFYDDSLCWFESDSSEYLWIPHGIDGLQSPGEMEVVPVGDSVNILVCESQTGILHNYVPSVEGESVTWEDNSIPGTYPDIYSIDVNDIDRDGDMDIVLSEYNGGRVVLLECISWFDDFELHVVDSLISAPACVRMDILDLTYETPAVVASSYDDESVYLYETWELGGEWTRTTLTDSLWGAWGLCICDIDSTGDAWKNVVASGCYNGDVRWYSRYGEENWKEYVLGDLDGATGLCASDIDGTPGLEVAAVAGIGESIKYWSPGFHSPAGELTSAILDAGMQQIWNSISWTADVPVDSTLSVKVRTSDDWEDMGAWSEALYEPSDLSSIVPGPARYFQYRVIMESPDSVQTPVVHDVTVSREYVSIDESEQEEIPPETLVLLSSNPSRNSIQFGVNTSNTSRISLLDLSGRVVEEYVAGEERENVFLTGKLEPGIYFLRADNEDIGTKRIVVIK